MSCVEQLEFRIFRFFNFKWKTFLLNIISWETEEFNLLTPARKSARARVKKREKKQKLRWEWRMCGSTEECVLGLRTLWWDWKMCGSTEECVEVLKNVWREWGLCGGTEDSVVGLRTLWKYRRICGGTEECVEVLKNVWRCWRMCGGNEDPAETEECVVGLRTLWWYWRLCGGTENSAEVLKNVWRYWRMCSKVDPLTSLLWHFYSMLMFPAGMMGEYDFIKISHALVSILGERLTVLNVLRNFVMLWYVNADFRLAVGCNRSGEMFAEY